jgi:hypothetical protein
MRLSTEFDGAGKFAATKAVDASAAHDGEAVAVQALCVAG